MDIQTIMKQASVMQGQMLQLQKELGDQEIKYSVGDGLVEITMSGRKNPLGIKLDPRVMDLKDVGLLEEMIMLALNRAVEEVDDILGRRTEELMAGLSLPANFSLPEL